MNRLLSFPLTWHGNTICHIYRLPNEVLLQIAGHLGPKLPDLNALVHTDRFLHRLLMPELHAWGLRVAPDSYARTTLRKAAARRGAPLLSELLVLGKGIGLDAAEAVNGSGNQLDS